MALFQKKQPETPPEPPKSPARQINLEAEVRARVFDHLTIEAAAAAHMSLDELRAFVGRQYFPSDEQLVLLANAMKAPISAREIIRKAMRKRLAGGRFPDWGAASLRRYRTTTGGEEDVLSTGHNKAVRAFVEGDDNALTIDEINLFVRDQWGDSEYDPAADLLRKVDKAHRMNATPPPAKIRPVEEILGPGVERMGLGWAASPGRAPRPVNESPSVKAGPPPGWA